MARFQGNVRPCSAVLLAKSRAKYKDLRLPRFLREFKLLSDTKGDNSGLDCPHSHCKQPATDLSSACCSGVKICCRSAFFGTFPLSSPRMNSAWEMYKTCLPRLFSQTEREFLSFEGEGLVELKVAQTSPGERFVHLADVVVDAKCAQKVVHVDDDDADQGARRIALHEDHLVEGVLGISQLEQSGGHLDTPEAWRVSQTIDVRLDEVQRCSPVWSLV